MIRKGGLLLGTAMMLLLGAPASVAHNGQHPSGDNHMKGPGAFGDVELVGKVTIKAAADDRVADVGALKNYAYLGAFAQDSCEGNEGVGPDGGVYVIDISNPTAPKEVGFIRAHQDTYVGEGVQALTINTPSYSGDILVLNNEACGKNYKAGFSIWNINNPRKPLKLSENVGDFTVSDQPNRPHDANQIHSVFAWQAGQKAYMVIVDDDEAKDVDIFDITNPKKPKFITEIDAEEAFAGKLSPQRAHGSDVFLHDMIVKKIGDKYYMLMSYWDAGWIVMDVTDPANPQYVDDTDYPEPDPLMSSILGKDFDAEGNAHQAEFSRDNQFIIGTDEDFSPYRATFAITSGPNAGAYPAGEFGWTSPIASLPDKSMNGPTVFGGYGCNDDVADIPAPSTVPAAGLNEEKILVLSRGPVSDPNHDQHDACTFEEKVINAKNAGYSAVIIANHHVGAGAGTEKDAFICGSGSAITGISAACIGHRAFHKLFNTAEDYTVPYPATADGSEPALGAAGASVAFSTVFDGWGYVKLFNSSDLTNISEIDSFAIPQAFDEDYASGYGALSVHEVAMDPDENRAYLSYYAGGFRALKYSSAGIVQTGGYLDPNGNDFWGVEMWTKPGTTDKYILASDMDGALYIFKIDSSKTVAPLPAPAISNPAP